MVRLVPNGAVARKVVVDAYAGTRTTVTLAPGETKSFAATLRGRWYELALLLEGRSAASFLRAYAGHLAGAIDRTQPLDVARDPEFDPVPAI